MKIPVMIVDRMSQTPVLPLRPKTKARKTSAVPIHIGTAVFSRVPMNKATICNRIAMINISIPLFFLKDAPKAFRHITCAILVKCTAKSAPVI